MLRDLIEWRHCHGADLTDEIDEATEPGRDGFFAQSRKANPQSGLPSGDGNGRAVVASGSTDRAALPEAGKRASADALGHDVADSLHAAMVWLLRPGDGRTTARCAAAAPVCRPGRLRRRAAGRKHHSSVPTPAGET